MSEDTKLILDKLDGVESRLEKVERENCEMSIRIESRIKPDIQMLARSYFDLSKKLDFSTEFEQRKSLCARISILERDMQLVKAKVGIV